MQFLAIAFAGFIGVILAFFLFSGISSITSNAGNFSAGSMYSHLTYESVAKAYGWNSRTKGEVLGETVQVTSFSFPDRDIVSVLNDIPGTSRFQALFSEAGGASYLVEPTLYTLFVPTDAAFSALTYDAKAYINTLTQEEKQRFVTYHMVPQKMVAVDGGVKAGTVAAVSRDYLNFELRKKDGGTVGNARVVQTYTIENGIIYVVDGVLLPPERMPGL